MPSVSQLTAARKAAKARRVIEKQTRANIGAGRDRNQTATVKAAQARRRLAMQKGAPADSDTRFYDLMRNHLHLQELVYTPENRSITIGVFEKTIRAMRITAALYQDDKLQRATKEAEAVLNRTNEAAFDALSPNQKRAFLHPLAVLCAFAEHYGATVPADTAQICGYYNAAVQFCLYMAALYDRPLWQVEAVFAVAKGASIRALAKERGIKENTLRDTNTRSGALLLQSLRSRLPANHPPRRHHPEPAPRPLSPTGRLRHPARAGAAHRRKLPDTV